MIVHITFTVTRCIIIVKGSLSKFWPLYLQLENKTISEFGEQLLFSTATSKPFACHWLTSYREVCDQKVSGIVWLMSQQWLYQLLASSWVYSVSIISFSFIESKSIASSIIFVNPSLNSRLNFCFYIGPSENFSQGILLAENRPFSTLDSYQADKKKFTDMSVLLILLHQQVY